MKNLSLETAGPPSARPRGKSALRLTGLSSCAGCAAKLGQAALNDVLQRLPDAPRDPRLLVGAGTADDAGVYALNGRLALVQTVDFFTPIVDDPFDYGQIAATNALSDVYAMGGRPLTALNLLGVPDKVLEPAVVAEILRGGLLKATEARCTIAGGHTIRLPEPVYGMAVTGTVSPRHVIANTGGRAGDVLVLTKPIGTGIVTTALKRGLASPALRRAAITSMTTLNRAGAAVAEQRLVTAGTDITGFGLMGHLANICRGSGLAAELDADAVPTFGSEVFELIDQDCVPGGSRQNLKTADAITEWNGLAPRHRILVTDAQTSGGLLLCVAPARLDRLLVVLRHERTLCASIVGKLVRANEPAIRIVHERRRAAGLVPPRRRVHSRRSAA